MIKALFITEKYMSPNPIFGHHNFGITNNMYNIAGSWKCANLGPYEHRFISTDPGDCWSTPAVDNVLLTTEYDFAFISVFNHLPSHDILRQVGHKVAMGWWDASVSTNQFREYSRFCHQLCFDYGYGEESPNCFHTEVPQDTTLFFKDDTPEDIDVSFCGNVDSPRPDRSRSINQLREAGINVFVAGGRGPEGQNMDFADYAAIFRRSKICLNFSIGHGRPQRKGRAFEIAACGQFMLSNQPEMFNGRDGSFFTEHLEYGSFNDDTLVEKVKYYLEHNDGREAMADRLYERWKNNFSPVHFWTKVAKICNAL